MTAKKATTPKNAPKKGAKATTKEVVKATNRKELTADSIYSKFIGAKTSTDRLQPRKETLIYVDIENEGGETETHLLDMKQVPQEIQESWS